MKRYRWVPVGIAPVLISAALVAAADSTTEEAIKKDRARYNGTWRVASAEVNGKAMAAEQSGKFTVVNQGDTWIVHVEGKEVMRGTSTIDPTKTPKTIDFTPTTGDQKGKLCLGIYAIDGDSRKLCFAQPGKARPTEFVSKEGRDHILVTFDRAKECESVPKAPE